MEAPKIQNSNHQYMINERGNKENIYQSETDEGGQEDELKLHDAQVKKEPCELDELSWAREAFYLV